MAGAASVIDVEQTDFEQQVLERSKTVPVVVDFWAPWCGPCRMLGPVLERLVEERHGEVILAKVNVDEAQELAARFGINSIPAVIGFRDGQPVLDFVGLLPEPQIREFIERLLPSQADRLARQAADVEQSRPAEAEHLYREALRLDRNHEAAQLGLARTLIVSSQDAEASELLENFAAAGELAQEAERLKAMIFLRECAKNAGTESEIRARLSKTPDDAEALYQLGCVLGAAGQYQKALESLLAAAQRDSRLASGKGRETMVKIFQVIGVRSPLADEYRDKLTGLLY